MIRKPFISQKAVRAALDTLIYSSDDRGNPLLSLLFIDEFLINPDLPFSNQSREFALNHILISLISDELQQYLSVHSEHPPAPQTSRETVLKWVATLVKYQSSELSGWIWLYLHYVAVHFNISSQEFCKQTHIDERTLRRYQQYGIKQLTNKLIELEWKTRRNQRQRRLYAELPSMGISTLKGREAELRQVRNLLAEAAPAHIQVTGLEGIGKTALVETVLGELIDGDQIHRVVWLSNPPTLRFAQEYILEQLLPEDSQLTLRDYLVAYVTVIILDGFEFRGELDALSLFLQTLSFAKVLITSRVRIPLPHLAAVHLTELEEQDAKPLILQVLRHSDSTLSWQAIDTHTQMIWEATGGNPRAIHVAASNPGVVYDPDILTETLIKLFRNTFYGFEEGTQLVWCMLALMPMDQHHSLDDLVDLLPGQEVSQAVFRLIEAHLLEVADYASPQIRFSLGNAARHYIERSYNGDDLIKEIVDRLLSMERSATSLLNVVEYILSRDKIQVAEEMKWNLIKQWWGVGLSQHHWSTWRFLLEPYAKQLGASELELYVGYGICLRGIGEGKLAYQVFENAIAAYGRAGDFVRQAGIFVELSMLLRRQGEYEKAASLLSRAQRVASRFHQNDILSAIGLERVQIAVDLKDMQAAKNWVALLPNSIRGDILAAEVHLLLGDIQTSHRLAAKLLDRVRNDVLVESRIHTVLGRGYEAQKNIDKAHEHFLLALMKLEQQDDIWGLSRVQSNLGAILLEMRSFDDAQTLLSSAQDIQFLIGDRVGLAITQHNLRLLQVALSS